MSRNRHARGRSLCRPWLFAATFAAGTLAAPAATLPGERALLNGDIAQSISELQASLARTDSPSSHLLLCRAFYAENRFNEAVDQCALSTAAPNPTSAAFLWQARALGGKAQASNPLAAFALARQVRSSFVEAVQLDPNNLDAVEDLGEFYVEAPGIVGGGIAHARELAVSVSPRSRRMEHTLLAMAFAREGEKRQAEHEYREAIAASGPAEVAPAWIGLAVFFRRSGQADAAVEAVHRAVTLDPSHSGSLVDAARTLMRLHREPEFAARCLREYIDGANHTDATPVFRARLQLARLLQSAGDTAAAARERAIAKAMAPDYLPPKRDESSGEQVR